jgi:hypothetical protein
MGINSGNVKDRELQKFVESPSRPGKPAVEVTGYVTVSEFGIGYNIFQDDAPVSSNTVAELISMTVPTGKQDSIKFIHCGGENIAKYYVKVNGSKVAQASTYFGMSFDVMIDLGGMKLVSGDVLSVDVDNYRNSVANFNARIAGVRLDVV